MVQWKKIARLVAVVAFALFARETAVFSDDAPFAAVTESARVALSPEDSSEFTVSLYLSIPEGHYLYRDKTQFSIADTQGAVAWTGQVDWPPAHMKDDPFLGETTAIWTDPEIAIPLHFKVLDASRLPTRIFGTVTLQGCSQSICFRPVRREFSVDVGLGADDVSSLSVPSSPSQNSDSDLPFAERAKHMFAENFSAGLAISFAGGVLADFTPCVLPIIPLLLLFIGVRREGHRWGNMIHVSLLIFGMSLSYAVLGILVAFLGLNLGFLFRSQVFLGFLTVFFVFMALALFDVWTFQLPLAWRNRLSNVGGRGLWGNFAAGFSVGLLALPCVGPIVAALLVFVSTTGDYVKGASYLFAFGLGMGSLFWVAALSFKRLAPLFGKGYIALWFKKLLALSFLALALYYGVTFVRGWTGEEETGVFLAAVHRAEESGRPIAVDFRADWCVPCLEMEATTFRNPRVRRLLDERFVFVSLDCTHENAECDELLRQNGVVGFPAILFFSPSGEPLSEWHWLSGYIDADAFSSRLEAVLSDIQSQK